MYVDGVTLIDPRDHACTIASFSDGSLRIATWSRLAEERARMSWFRQTPPCLVEDSVSHPALRNEDERRWGAMPDGATVIRRSALGLNAESNVLYMGVSNDTAAGAIGLAMRHAGAVDVAELDVNWSFPHFVLFQPSADGSLKALGLFEGFLFDPDNYVNKPSSRDFFYLVRSEDDS